MTARQKVSVEHGLERALAPITRSLLTLARLWLKVFYRLRVEGLENVPLEGPCLLTPSHMGKLLADLTVLAIVVSRRVPVVFSPTDIGDSTYGYFRAARRRSRRASTRSAGPLPMVGGSKLDNLQEAMPVAEALVRSLSEGEMVLLYPEGEVSWHGRLNPTRPLAAWIALHGQAPIVPCIIDGAYDMWPRWAARPSFRGRLTIRFGRPYRLQSANSEADISLQLEHAGQRIMTEIGQLRD